MYITNLLTIRATGTRDKAHKFCHWGHSSFEHELWDVGYLLLYLKIPTFHQIIEGMVQLLFTGLRIAVALDSSAHISSMLLLTSNQKINQLGRIDEGEGSSVSTAIFVEDTSEGLTANLDF